MKLQALHNLLFLWAVPVLAGIYLYAWYCRWQALQRFAERDLLPQLSTSVCIAVRRWKQALVLLAFILMVVGLSRPAWTPVREEVHRQGRDVVFVLDVSRSMLAEDLKPNRLERAKLAIQDCVDRIRGDRVGLVTFAGTAVVRCPLTLDYGFFRMMLKDATTQSAGRGGTMVGDALRKVTADVFDDLERKHKDIILITDGEDHDSYPLQAASDAGARGVRLIAVGIGDEEEGQRIPITDENGRRAFVTYKGEEIWSKLDGDTLRRMVNATPGGQYLPVRTGAIDLGSVYTRLIASAEKKVLESKTVERYEERFQIFIALALILLIAEMVLSERKRGA